MLMIVQNQFYRGNDWWDWNVWIEGQPEELGDIEEVVWHLHPTFTPAQVTRQNRAEGFRLSTSGWGSFTITAELHLSSGSTQRMTHELELYYPDEEVATTPIKFEGRSKVGGYVHALVMPPSPAGDHRHSAPKRFDERWPLVVVGQQIVEFAAPVPGTVRQAVCHSLLIGQLAAKHRVSDAGGAVALYQAYGDVLSNLGFALIGQSSQAYQEGFVNRNERLHEVAIRILVTMLGPSAAGSSRLVQLLTQPGLLYGDASWITLLLDNRRSTNAARLGFTLIDGGTNDSLQLTSLLIAVDSSKEIANDKIFFLRVATSDVRVQTWVTQWNIDVASLTYLEDALAKKVAPFLPNICGLEIGQSLSTSRPLQNPALHGLQGEV